MRVLVTGGAGKLGRALMDAAPVAHDVVDVSRDDLDLSDPASVERCLAATAPEVILNAAAYTHVDGAEGEPARAFAANASGVAELARLAARCGARVVHVSTDYVFDGRQSHPYRETDDAAPINVYGCSKLEGEQHLSRLLGAGALTIRTSWLYGAAPRNFLTTMLTLMSKRERVRVVADQVGSPTSTRSLAEAIWRACEQPRLCGLLHWSDAGVASWYDFAVAIQEEALGVGLLRHAIPIVATRSSEYATAARRPPYSVLDCGTARAALDLAPLHWRARLREVLREIAGD